MTAPAIPRGYSPPRDLLAGRIVLVTGAGDGLGRAAALACAAHGATVVLLGRTAAKLERVYDAIRDAGGPEAAICPMNLAGATWNDHASLAATVEREFGVLHGLLHCAAHFSGFAPLSETDPREWMDSLQVNVTSAFALTVQCLPQLQKAEDASVVFVTDRAGRQAKAFSGPYGVSKAAVEALMCIWANELEAQGRPRFNAFDPGPMKTALRRRGYIADSEDARDPRDLVVPLLWLLGPDSRGANGATFSPAD